MPSSQQQWRKSGRQKQIAIGAGAGKTRIFKAAAGDFKVKASPTQLFLDTSPVIPNVKLVNVHSLIKRLFSKEMLTKAVNIPPAGRISHFLVNWQKLTLNQDILPVVKGYKIPLSRYLFNEKFQILQRSTRSKLILWIWN